MSAAIGAWGNHAAFVRKTVRSQSLMAVVETSKIFTSKYPVKISIEIKYGESLEYIYFRLERK